MKIENLIINNFRGIQRLEASDLGDTVIVSGQNGSGKSCIFDAIRLLKSTYGGYHQNEWQHFFGEFQIQLQGGSKNLKGLFNDPTKSTHIEISFRLRDAEKSFVHDNAAELIEQMIWQTLLPEDFQYGGYHKALFSNQFRERQPEVNQRVQETLPILKLELATPQITARIEIAPTGAINISNSTALSVIFSNYRPREIGVIDFHGAQRHYGREIVQGINLSLDQTNQAYSQHTLYNYNNKYNNVKSEMAGNFIKELLAEQAGEKAPAGPASLTSTLKELFESFFPDKKFAGPRPTADGSLSFPVITQSGTEHDLDELSSGEKEILYGYLRIRSSAPKNSIILLDEPELHLNPRLIRGLPEFYRKHLGEALQNQLWLVTHSDALIREAVGKPGFNVFHMLPCGAEGAGNSQLKPLTVTKDLDLALADLVDDLASYRPGGKGLIFEGGGDSDFDKTLASTLFSDELRGINLISGTNKLRVKVLHEVLDRAYMNGDLPTKFFAIVDSDSEEKKDASPAINRFEWDVYHIENYLLEEKFLSEAMNMLKIGSKYDITSVNAALEGAARNVVGSVLIHKMKYFVNSKIVNEIDLGFSPNTLTIGKDIHAAAERTLNRLSKTINISLSEQNLVTKEIEYRNQIQESFVDGTWKIKLPGREILKQLVVKESIPVSYEILRNLVVSRMAEAGFKPNGMKNIIEKIRIG